MRWARRPYLVFPISQRFLPAQVKMPRRLYRNATSKGYKRRRQWSFDRPRCLGSTIQEHESVGALNHPSPSEFATGCLTEHRMSWTIASQVDYFAQIVRMSDLRTTLLAPGKWEQPGGLRFEEEVGADRAGRSRLWLGRRC